MADVAEAEQAAIKTDAELRLRELCRVRSCLWPSRDDAAVMSELVAV